MRNPYRSTFHPVTGDLWIGDVGSSCSGGTPCTGELAYEEINRLPAPLTATPMKNFGWPCREGSITSPTGTGFNLCSGTITLHDALLRL